MVAHRIERIATDIRGYTRKIEGSSHNFGGGYIETTAPATGAYRERLFGSRADREAARDREHRRVPRGGVDPHEAPTTHFVEAKFELGEHVLASLHKGDAVIVVGYERTVAWGEREDRRTGRVLEADAIGPDLSRATAVVTRSQRRNAACEAK